jgi:hypothetical protein
MGSARSASCGSLAGSASFAPARHAAAARGQWPRGAWYSIRVAWRRSLCRIGKYPANRGSGDCPHGVVLQGVEVCDRMIVTFGSDLIARLGVIS